MTDSSIKESPVKARLAKTLVDTAVQKIQSQRAAVVISQFMLVVQGLEDSVPKDQLFNVAATLTAGIWAADTPD